MTTQETRSAPDNAARGGWPTVGVVVPTRDRPELLRKALQRILDQDYPGDVRCVVVFDHSEPDEGLAVDDEHRGVMVMGNERSPGLAGGRNSGILAADTELVAFCDDDDAWLPGKLRAQVEELVAHPEASLVSCGIRVVYDGATTDRVLADRRVTLPDLLRSRLTELHPSTFLMRRATVVDGFGLVDEHIPGSYGEDYEFLLRATRHGPVVNLPDVLVEVLWHKKSYFASRWDTIITALRWLLERYPEFRSVPAGEARICGQIAFAYAAQGRRREAVRWVAKTLRRNPREARAVLALAVASRAITADSVLRRLHERGRGV